MPDREDRDELDGQTLTGKAPRDLKRALGSFDPEQICAACGKWDAGGGAVALKRCANCRAIFYCSRIRRPSVSGRAMCEPVRMARACRALPHSYTKA